MPLSDFFRVPKGSLKGPGGSFFRFSCPTINYLSNETNNKSFLQSVKSLSKKQGELSNNLALSGVLNSYLHTKIRYITKMSLWKAGQSFLAKIDYFIKVDHISKKLTLALFDIRPTTHLVCTLLFSHRSLLPKKG